MATLHVVITSRVRTSARYVDRSSPSRRLPHNNRGTQDFRSGAKTCCASLDIAEDKHALAVAISQPELLHRTWVRQFNTDRKMQDDFIAYIDMGAMVHDPGVVKSSDSAFVANVHDLVPRAAEPISISIERVKHWVC